MEITIDKFLDINAHNYPNREDVLFQHAKIFAVAVLGCTMDHGVKKSVPL